MGRFSSERYTTDEELDALIATLLEEPAFHGMAVHHLQWILRANPDYPVIARRNHAEWLERSRLFDAVLEPVIAELTRSGVPATSNDYMDHIAPAPYAIAIPILVRWLPRIEHIGAKDWVARCLTVRMARPYVPAIITEFRRLRGQEKNVARWAVGNAIGFQLDHELAEDAIAIAADPGFGHDRSEIVRNLWRLKGDDRVFPLLVELLYEDDTIGLVPLEALRHLADPRARPHFERFLIHPEAWVRNQARKGIAKLDRQQAKAEGRPLPKPVKRPRPAKPEQPQPPWPSGLPHTGLVAIIRADLVRIEALAGSSRSTLLAMDGIGPKTIERIERELKVRMLPPLTD